MDCSLEMLKLLLRYEADPDLLIRSPACHRKSWDNPLISAGEAANRPPKIFGRLRLSAPVKPDARTLHQAKTLPL